MWFKDVWWKLPTSDERWNSKACTCICVHSSWVQYYGQNIEIKSKWLHVYSDERKKRERKSFIYGAQVKRVPQLPSTERKKKKTQQTSHINTLFVCRFLFFFLFCLVHLFCTSVALSYQKKSSHFKHFNGCQ